MISSIGGDQVRAGGAAAGATGSRIDLPLARRIPSPSAATISEADRACLPWRAWLPGATALAHDQGRPVAALDACG